MASFERFISKVPLDSPSNKTAVIRTVWHESQIDFTILLLDQQASLRDQLTVTDEYTGTLPMEQLRKNAGDLEIPYDEFLADTKKIFSSPNGHPDYNYDCEDGIFRWSKNTTSALKLLYGLIILDQVANQSPSILFDLLAINTDLSRKYDDCSSQMQRLQVELSECETLLDQTIGQKETSERMLIAKFTVLLNEKKSKISQLEHFVGNLKSYERSSGTGSNTKDNSIDRNANKRTMSIDSEGSEDVIAQSKVRKRTKGFPKHKSAVDLPVASTSHADLQRRNAFENQSKEALLAAERNSMDKQEEIQRTNPSLDIYEKDTEQILDNMLDEM